NDNQLGFRNVDAWATGTSNPDFEKNITAFLKNFRTSQKRSLRGSARSTTRASRRCSWRACQRTPLHAAESVLWTDGAGVYVNAEEGALEVEQGQDGYVVDMLRIILVGEATKAFGKAGAGAQTVHDVHVESLKELVEARGTAGVVDASSDD
ncbi:hypothetical protein TOPH_06355, partial [Tolypocladium ophioglossoides CBS 100239]